MKEKGAVFHETPYTYNECFSYCVIVNECMEVRIELWRKTFNDNDNTSSYQSTSHHVASTETC